MLIVHKIASWVLKRRIEQIEHFVRYPHKTQNELLKQLLHKAANTEWGRKYGYREIDSHKTFSERVPVSTYEQLFPYVEKMLKGEKDVLWPGGVNWFAKSSGTTNDKSKFIPISPESLEDCHFRAGQDMLSLYLHNRPNSKLFSGKSLSIGGSHTINRLNEHSRYGDLSAVILENLPPFYELVRTPSKEVALMDDWDRKIEAMANEVMNKDVTAIAGVPTWTLVLINRIFEKLNIEDRNLLRVWPNLELYVHGGVSFEPYREQFKQLVPSDEMTYLDCYNASEGFFSIQDDFSRNDMLLMLDYGIFYEFIPMEEVGKPFPRSLSLDQVELDTHYAMVISTNGGLWRYMIGDTISFTSRYPYKIRVTGRTKHFINAFGEELMVDNAETALSEASKATGAIIGDYTAGPIYFDSNSQGGHEWLLEFVQMPDDFNRFCELMDRKLMEVNTDYEAKRTDNLALKAPIVRVLPPGTFHQWMKKRGKLGGQHKVPRLANHRDYLEDILEMMASNPS